MPQSIPPPAPAQPDRVDCRPSPRDTRRVRQRLDKFRLLFPLIVIAAILLRHFIAAPLRMLIRRFGISEVLIATGVLIVTVGLVGAVSCYLLERIVVHRKVAGSLLTQVDLARQPRRKLQDDTPLDDGKEAKQP